MGSPCPDGLHWPLSDRLRGCARAALGMHESALQKPQQPWGQLPLSVPGAPTVHGTPETALQTAVRLT